MPPCPWASQVAVVAKNLPASAGDIRDAGLIPGLGRSPGGGHGNPLQYACLENPHGQKRLVGCSPWGCTESDTTMRALHPLGGKAENMRLWTKLSQSAEWAKGKSEVLWKTALCVAPRIIIQV